MNNWIKLTLASILLLLALIPCNWQVIRYSQSYQRLRTEYAGLLNFQERLLDPKEWISDTEQNPRLIRATSLQEAYKQAHVQLYLWTWICGIIMLSYLGFLWLSGIYRDSRALVIGLGGVALACLHIGLFTPMLEIAAFDRKVDLGDIPIRANVLSVSVEIILDQTFEGDMYFYYQCKSVIQLISMLFDQRNYVVGVSILAFSILFPLVKLVLIIGAVAAPQIMQLPPVAQFVHYSGKWSMADVFVVALFLGFLAFDNVQTGIPTTSSIMVGMYFFLSYCVISIYITRWLHPH